MHIDEKRILRFTVRGQLYEVDESLVLHTEPHRTVPGCAYIVLANGRQLSAENIEFVTKIEQC
ncbi:hypothetical protein GBN32_00365 [Plesiomonas shigelloides]|uniref:hypothetical protein n=1 Tax=Plesiomonas shigelloides TaxID=703 RepID=UPI0012628689|nr:hypothetical protein [Plesiomonas shigelloides]KAB7715725.1 hypothetical protein GBN32_00365 [Plesiomonas shigelloides]